MLKFVNAAGNGPTSSAPTPASEPVGSPADSSNDTPQVPSGSVTNPN